MLALVVTVPAGEVELASDALWALGVVAIEERTTEGSPATEDHLVELWTSLGEDVETITRAAEAFPARWRWRTVAIDPAVTETWRAHAVPSWVDRDLVVVPAWQDVATPAGALRVDIDPGAAFGLGDHADDGPHAAAAARRDLAGRDGARRGLRQRRAVGRRRSPRRAVRRGDRRLAGGGRGDDGERPAQRGRGRRSTSARGRSATISGEFDIVLANLLAPIVVELAPQLRRATAPAGALVVSGILADAHDHVIAALGADARRRDGARATTGPRCCCVTERRAGRGSPRRGGSTAPRRGGSSPAHRRRRRSGPPCRAGRRPPGAPRARRRTRRRRPSCRPARTVNGGWCHSRSAVTMRTPAPPSVVTTARTPPATSDSGRSSRASSCSFGTRMSTRASVARRRGERRAPG